MMNETDIIIPPDIQEMLDATRPTHEYIDELRQSIADLDRDPEFVAGFSRGVFVEDMLQAMREQKIKQSGLATRLGKKRQYVNQIIREKGNFTVETMAEIACALGMQLAVRMYRFDERFNIVPASAGKLALIPWHSPGEPAAAPSPPMPSQVFSLEKAVGGARGTSKARCPKDIRDVKDLRDGNPAGEVLYVA